MTPQERFWAKVDKSGDCWLWIGAKTHDGYGRLRVGKSFVYAHRAAYEWYVGDIPEGIEIDHKCHYRACVRPIHLRRATRKQNRENLAGAYKTSKSGIRGVLWHKGNQKWQASVQDNGKRWHLGSFLQREDAEAAVIAKRNELFTFNEKDRQ